MKLVLGTLVRYGGSPRILHHLLEGSQEQDDIADEERRGVQLPETVSDRQEGYLPEIFGCHSRWLPDSHAVQAKLHKFAVFSHVQLGTILICKITLEFSSYLRKISQSVKPERTLCARCSDSLRPAARDRLVS